MLQLGPARFQVGSGGDYGLGFVALDSGLFEASVSSPFGPRDPLATAGGTTSAGHLGVDLTRPGIAGAPLPHLGDRGTVTAAGPALNGYGNAVFVRTEAGYNVLYAHLQDGAHAGVGQTIERGGIVGQVGTTGYSTGPHVHLGVTMAGIPAITDVSRWIDPGLWLDPMRFFASQLDGTGPVVDPPLSGALPGPGGMSLMVVRREVSPEAVRRYLEEDPTAAEHSLWMLVAGVWQAYIFGAPAPVNAGFPDPIPGGAAVLVLAA